jgi:uncharacterized protein YoxC
MSQEMLIWLGGVAISAIGALIVALAILHLRAISQSVTELRREMQNIRESVSKVENQVSEFRKETVAHSETVALRLFEQIEKVKARTDEVSVTIAGFGGTYLPRREWEMERARLEKKG